MKTLIICNTTYQLIVAIQLKLTLFQNEDVGICISDHFWGAQKIAERLVHTELFSKVHFSATKQEVYGFATLTTKAKIKKFIDMNFGSIANSEYVDYDTLVFYNIQSHFYEVLDSMTLDGKVLHIFRMEEGLSSCKSDVAHNWHINKIMTFCDEIRRFTSRPRASQLVEGFYCFIPELCNEKFNPIKIPSPAENRDELIAILCEVFAYQGFPYSHRYIFFASSHEIDGTPIGESEIIFRLAECVGTDNLLVKMHPRDGRHIYQDAGITVMENSYIPWEVIQLCEDISDRALLTCVSGSPLTITALLKDGTCGAYLTPTHPTVREQANLDVARARKMHTLSHLHDLGLCEDIHETTIGEFCVGI